MSTATEARERPILFSDPMVRAILLSKKTQTRRVVKHPDWLACLTGDCPHNTQAECNASLEAECPYGKPGDRLWVREAFYPSPSDTPTFCGFYRATDPDRDVKWSPSIHMPRAASRITLEITEVRAERLQEISEYDAWCEGATQSPQPVFPDSTYRKGFAAIWQTIHAPDGPNGWERNPWVWVITFERIDSRRDT